MYGAVRADDSLSRHLPTTFQKIPSRFPPQVYVDFCLVLFLLIGGKPSSGAYKGIAVVLRAGYRVVQFLVINCLCVGMRRDPQDPRLITFRWKRVIWWSLLPALLPIAAEIVQMAVCAATCDNGTFCQYTPQADIALSTPDGPAEVYQYCSGWFNFWSFCAGSTLISSVRPPAACHSAKFWLARDCFDLVLFVAAIVIVQIARAVSETPIPSISLGPHTIFPRPALAAYCGGGCFVSFVSFLLGSSFASCIIIPLCVCCMF